jgi:apolipoprotein N-acyltransferase
MTAGEMARALVVDRLSSLSMGYALIDTWLAGWAPVLGAYGLSWIGYWLGAALALNLTARRQATARRLLDLTPLAGLLLAGLLLQQVHWTESLGRPLLFRLVQPNTHQGKKFDPAFQARLTRQVLDMLTAEPADLVVAPETAFPLYWNELPSGTIKALQDFATRSGSHLMFGVATVGSQAQGHNSMVHLQPHWPTASLYDKIHLFPFGEYTPKALGWITRDLAIPMQDLSAGEATQSAFTLAHRQRTLAIGTLICNENMISDEARRWAPLTNLLINPGNMAWFDGTLAIDQGQQITRMRALEVSRPILRVSNTGDTALISESGVLIHALPLGVATSMTGTITGQTGLTPYVRWGDWPVGALCLLSLAGALLARKTNRLRWRRSRETAPRCSQTG